MEQSSYTVRVLTPNPGYKLTQTKDVDVINRIISDKVYLAVNDDPDNWREITQEEADEIMAEKERLAQSDNSEK